MSSHPSEHTPDQHHDTRQRIDDQITHLEAQIHQLKSLRNTYAPIQRLHAEILGEIFFLAHINSEQKGRATLTMTWICQEWRQLAHNASALWCHVDFKHPEWVQAALSRTKKRELEIYLDSGTCTCGSHRTNSNDLAEICLGALSRITTLEIISQNGTLSSNFSQSLDEWRVPAPLLVELHLQSLTLPDDIFSGTFPALQSLRLKACSIDWDKPLQLPVHPGLIELVIIEPISRAPLDPILNVLQIVGPNLEYLHLDNVFVDPPEEPTEVLEDKVQLDNLYFFKVDQHFPEMIVYLLERISFPPSLTIEISIKDRVQPDLIQALVSARNLEEWPVDCVEFIVANETSLKVRLVEVETDGGDDIEIDMTLDDQPYILLDLGLEDVDQGLGAFNLIPMRPIEKVHLLDTNGAVFDYIGNLGTVNDLRVSFGCMHEFLDFVDERVVILQQTPGHLKPPENDVALSFGKDTLAFRNLERLHIYGSISAPIFKESGDIESLRKWLKLKGLYDDQLESFTLSLLTISSAFRLTKIFRKVVGEFWMVDVLEESG